MHGFRPLFCYKCHKCMQVGPYVPVLPMVQLLPQLLPALQIPLSQDGSGRKISGGHDGACAERSASTTSPFQVDSIGYAGACALDRASRVLGLGHASCYWMSCKSHQCPVKPFTLRIWPLHQLWSTRACSAWTVCGAHIWLGSRPLSCGLDSAVCERLAWCARGMR